MAADAQYLSHRALIDRTIAIVCRRGRLSSSDAADFSQAVHLHLIEDDYAVLRAFQGRSEIGAFFYAVVRRCFQDWRNAQWGRWRPSAAVRRMGPIAMQLETLLVRDRVPLREAIEMLRTNHGVTESVSALEALAASFPPRTARSFSDDESLDDQAHEPSSAASRVDAADAAKEAGRISMALDRALSSLAAEDRVLLRLHCEDGVKVSTISRMLALEQQPLYRRINRLLRDVRAALEQAGVTAADAGEAIASRAFDLVEARETRQT